jgi:hypothetical protein
MSSSATKPMTLLQRAKAGMRVELEQKSASLRESDLGGGLRVSNDFVANMLHEPGTHLVEPDKLTEEAIAKAAENLPFISVQLDTSTMRPVNLVGNYHAWKIKNSFPIPGRTIADDYRRRFLAMYATQEEKILAPKREKAEISIETKVAVVDRMDEIRLENTFEKLCGQVDNVIKERGKEAHTWAEEQRSAVYDASEEELKVFTLMKERKIFEIEAMFAKGDVNVSTLEKGTSSTGLVRACSLGLLTVVKLYLNAGANVNYVMPSGLSSLHCSWDSWIQLPVSNPAKKMRFLIVQDIIGILIDFGANCNQANRAGFTPLHMASSFGHDNIVARMLRAGADSTRKDTEGRTACDLARLNGHLESVGLLSNWKHVENAYRAEEFRKEWDLALERKASKDRERIEASSKTSGKSSAGGAIILDSSVDPRKEARRILEEDTRALFAKSSMPVNVLLDNLKFQEDLRAWKKQIEAERVEMRHKALKLDRLRDREIKNAELIRKGKIPPKIDEEAEKVAERMMKLPLLRVAEYDIERDALREVNPVNDLEAAGDRDGFATLNLRQISTFGTTGEESRLPWARRADIASKEVFVEAALEIEDNNEQDDISQGNLSDVTAAGSARNLVQASRVQTKASGNSVKLYDSTKNMFKDLSSSTVIDIKQNENVLPQNLSHEGGLVMDGSDVVERMGKMKKKIAIRKYQEEMKIVEQLAEKKKRMRQLEREKAMLEQRGSEETDTRVAYKSSSPTKEVVDFAVESTLMALKMEEENKKKERLAKVLGPPADHLEKEAAEKKARLIAFYEGPPKVSASGGTDVFERRRAVASMISKDAAEFLPDNTRSYNAMGVHTRKPSSYSSILRPSRFRVDTRKLPDADAVIEKGRTFEKLMIGATPEESYAQLQADSGHHSHTLSLSEPVSSETENNNEKDGSESLFNLSIGNNPSISNLGEFVVDGSITSSMRADLVGVMGGQTRGNATAALKKFGSSAAFAEPALLPATSSRRVNAELLHAEKHGLSSDVQKSEREAKHAHKQEMTEAMRIKGEDALRQAAAAAAADKKRLLQDYRKQEEAAVEQFKMIEDLERMERQKAATIGRGDVWVERHKPLEKSKEEKIAESMKPKPGTYGLGMLASWPLHKAGHVLVPPGHNILETSMINILEKSRADYDIEVKKNAAAYALYEKAKSERVTRKRKADGSDMDETNNAHEHVKALGSIMGKASAAAKKAAELAEAESEAAAVRVKTLAASLGAQPDKAVPILSKLAAESASFVNRKPPPRVAAGIVEDGDNEEEDLRANISGRYSSFR